MVNISTVVSVFISELACVLVAQSVRAGKELSTFIHVDIPPKGTYRVLSSSERASVPKCSVFFWTQNVLGSPFSPILFVEQNVTSILLHVKVPVSQFGQGRLTALLLLVGEQRLDEEQLTLIQNKLLQENQPLIQEPQFRLPWHTDPTQLFIQVSALSFEPFCTLLYSKRLGCLTLNHISVYAHLRSGRHWIQFCRTGLHVNSICMSQSWELQPDPKLHATACLKTAQAHTANAASCKSCIILAQLVPFLFICPGSPGISSDRWNRGDNPPIYISSEGSTFPHSLQHTEGSTECFKRTWKACK